MWAAVIGAVIEVGSRLSDSNAEGKERDARNRLFAEQARRVAEQQAIDLGSARNISAASGLSQDRGSSNVRYLEQLALTQQRELKLIKDFGQQQDVISRNASRRRDQASLARTTQNIYEIGRQAEWWQ